MKLLGILFKLYFVKIKVRVMLFDKYCKNMNIKVKYF